MLLLVGVPAVPGPVGPGPLPARLCMARHLMTRTGKDHTVRSPKRAGTAYERKVADYAQEHGFPWERAPLRGSRDLLDLQGCLPAGWLIGCKGIRRGVNMSDRMSDAARQCERARANLEDLQPPGYRGDVIPVQVMQRSGYPIGKAYVVMSYDDFLAHAARVLELERLLGEAGQQAGTEVA